MKKLAIVEEREEDKYEHTLTIRCWLCEPTGGMPVPDALQDSKVHPSPYFPRNWYLIVTTDQNPYK